MCRRQWRAVSKSTTAGTSSSNQRPSDRPDPSVCANVSKRPLSRNLTRSSFFLVVRDFSFARGLTAAWAHSLSSAGETPHIGA